MELMGKIPPHNLEAEQATLGAMLLNWKAVSDVVTYLRADNFYDQRNKIIYDSMMSLFAGGVTGDLLTIIDDLTKKGKLDVAGGASYISSLTNMVPTSANVDYYAKIVLDNSTRRNLISISSAFVIPFDTNAE